MVSSAQSVYDGVRDCLLSTSIDDKVENTQTLVRYWNDGRYDCEDHSQAIIPDLTLPGRPDKPRLVEPRHLTRRSVHTPQGHAALIHAIAHIEFNAIDLALDAVYRFRQMPRTFIADWLKVAGEEAYHFRLLREHLVGMGYDYGDFDAHNGLWEMAQRTAHDVLVRMALVPRVMEARGLDVTPGIISRLQEIGDDDAVNILTIILRDEVGHVEIGTRWFHYLCDTRNLPRQETFEQLFTQYTKGRIKLPLHRGARTQAGFTEAELSYLEGLGW